jgi:hypothetical protein
MRVFTSSRSPPLAPTVKVSTNLTQDAAAERVGGFVAGSANIMTANMTRQQRHSGVIARHNDGGDNRGKHEMAAMTIAMIDKRSGTIKTF